MPSRRLPNGDSDGVPTVLVEALAHGVPVVATDVGSITDLVRDRETGLIVAPDNPEALADAILTMLTDKSLAQETAGRGAQLVRDHFDVEVTAGILATTIQVAVVEG
jgi:glycosyltransferase involved in cell wall biosynthesis